MTRLDRTLRWVWLINGIALLLLLVGGGIALLVAALSTLGGGDSAGSPSPASAAAKRDSTAPLRYDPPLRVRGSETRIVVVRRGTGYSYRNTSSSSGRVAEAPAVNVIFLDRDGGARLLLDRPGYISELRYPGDAREEARGDTLRWIVLEAALEDSNGDRAVNERDRRSLYVAALDGRSMRRVLPPGFELRDWAAEPGGGLVVTAVELRPGSGPMPERAFVVDPAGNVRPFAALDSAVAQAGRIVGNP
jgi:hypothetical protein